MKCKSNINLNKIWCSNIIKKRFLYNVLEQQSKALVIAENINYACILIYDKVCTVHILIIYYHKIIHLLPNKYILFNYYPTHDESWYMSD